MLLLVLVEAVAVATGVAILVLVERWHCLQVLETMKIETKHQALKKNMKPLPVSCNPMLETAQREKQYAHQGKQWQRQQQQ